MLEAMACNRLIRSSVGGCVLNRLAIFEAEKGVDDEHMRCGLVAVVHGHLAAVALNFLQRVGQGQGLVADSGAGLVGQVFARTRDAHLNEHGGHGSNQRDEQRGQRVGSAFLVVSAADAEDRGPLRHGGQVHHHRGHDARDTGNQDVAVFDVSEFVGQHAAQFVRVEQPQNALGHTDHTVFRIAAGGKSVGCFLRHDADTGFGNFGVMGQFGNDAVQSGRVFWSDFTRAVHGQHDFVRKPVTADVHGQGQEQGDKKPDTAPEGAADEDDQGRHQPEEKYGLDLTGHRYALLAYIVRFSDRCNTPAGEVKRPGTFVMFLSSLSCGRVRLDRADTLGVIISIHSLAP